MANALGVPWRLGVRLDLDTIGAPRGFSLPFNAVRWLALGFSESVCAGNRGMEEGGGENVGHQTKKSGLREDVEVVGRGHKRTDSFVALSNHY